MLAFPSFELTTVFITCSALAYLFYNLKRKYDFWKDRSIPQVGFSMDHLANLWKHRLTVNQKIYNLLDPLPFGGFYLYGVPYLMIRDLDLVRSILINDFSHFTDRGVLVGIEHDPLLRSNIFNLTGQKWKNIRTKLTPIFSSEKLKRMSVLLHECTTLLGKYLEQAVDESNDIEIRGFLQKFTADAIGICAFGIKGNAIENEKSDFRKVIKAISGPRLFTRSALLKFMTSFFPKRIMDYIKLEIIPLDVTEFFHSMVVTTMKIREEEKIKRHDLLQLLVNVRAKEKELIGKQNNSTEHLFDDEVCMANAFIFFAGGFDGISNTLSHCLYDLALHPKVMHKLHDEIKRIHESHDGNIDYYALKKMDYLDCCVAESLRLHPNITWVERICTKTYQLPNSSLVIEENTNVMLPMLGIHLDSKYYSDPHTYNPDRFKDSRANIIPGSYFPFGSGPRMCIAQRFALMEMKVVLAQIIDKYIVHPSEKTEIPLKVNPFSLLNAPKELYLKFHRRKN